MPASLQRVETRIIEKDIVSGFVVGRHPSRPAEFARNAELSRRCIPCGQGKLDVELQPVPQVQEYEIRQLVNIVPRGRNFRYSARLRALMTTQILSLML